METCKTIFALIGKSSEHRSYEDATQTPQHDWITRHLDSVILERESFAKNRTFMAQMLDEALDAGLLPVHKFFVPLAAVQENNSSSPTPKHIFWLASMHLGMCLIKLKKW
jgi:hypothetical protein